MKRAFDGLCFDSDLHPLNMLVQEMINEKMKWPNDKKRYDENYDRIFGGRIVKGWALKNKKTGKLFQRRGWIFVWPAKWEAKDCKGDDETIAQVEVIVKEVK